MCPKSIGHTDLLKNLIDSGIILLCLKKYYVKSPKWSVNTNKPKMKQ